MNRAFGYITLLITIGIIVLMVVLFLSAFRRQYFGESGSRPVNVIKEAEDVSRQETERLREMQRRAEELKKTLESTK